MTSLKHWILRSNSNDTQRETGKTEYCVSFPNSLENISQGWHSCKTFWGLIFVQNCSTTGFTDNMKRNHDSSLELRRCITQELDFQTKIFGNNSPGLNSHSTEMATEVWDGKTKTLTTGSHHQWVCTGKPYRTPALPQRGTFHPLVTANPRPHDFMAIVTLLIEKRTYSSQPVPTKGC